MTRGAWWRLIVSVWSLAFLGLAWCEPGFAASTDADGTYTVTVTLVEASNDGGANFITLFSGSQLINIAAVTAGASAAGLVSGVDFPVGTCDRVRVTISDTLLAKGYVNSGGSTFYTSGGVNGTSNVAGNDNTGAVSNYTASTYTIPEANRVNVNTVSIPIVKGKGTTMQVKFDTSGVLSYNGLVVIPGAPLVTISSE